jgi:NADPH:quinone reductase-like Zn-dependent oxidoreductase
MANNNKAAWLPEARGQLEIRDGPESQVGEYDVLIENKAVAINPGKRWALLNEGSALEILTLGFSGLEGSGLRYRRQRISGGEQALIFD